MEIFDSQETPEQKAYTGLANKYRPQTFEEVVGQESVSKTLVNALKTGRIAHAYLFYGPRGCGKTTSARLFAKALNCTGHPGDKPTASPCGKCPQCIEIAASSDMDVLELDAASNTGVDKVREAIIDTVALASGRDRYKVFILDEVHMLSSSAFNALLKTIEEPPRHVVFILATTELHKVPLTISSRCQTFRFKPITEAEISAHLMDLADAENLELEEDAAKIIARAAGGALRDALTIMDRAIAFSDGKVGKEMVSEMLGLMPQDLVKDAVCAVVRSDGPALHKVFETLQNEGYDALSLLKDLKSAFGEIFYLALNTGSEPFPGAKDILKEVSPGFVAGLTRKISKLTDEVRFSDTPLLSAEVGLFTIMENTLDIEGLISRLEALEDGSSSGGGTGGAEKKTLNNFAQMPAEQKTPTVKKKEPIKAQEASAPSPQNILPAADMGDMPSVWQAFKKELSKSFPFLFDIVQDIKPEFEAANKWALTFSARDSYFKDTVQKRVKDLRECAFKVCGADIDFTFSVSEGAASSYNPAPAKAQPKLTPPTTAVKKTAPKAAAQTPPAKEVISSEEPFAAGDYSAFLEDTAKPAVKEVGETAKKVLNIFEGYITESV